MEFELWWLLALPLFFGLGWLAARVDIRHAMSESRSLPASYFKGLNYLLNEQPDKAIEAFIEVVKVDSDTVDLHFALGGLFRKRGEVERAIRMHQNLVERDDLPDEQKLKALSELGQDYLKAGLLDRAEDIFNRLEKTAYAGQARKFLLEIYVQVKDWHKAIAAARELALISSQPYHIEIAHYFCELATIENVHGNPQAARAHLEEALAVNRNCVRANMLLGEIEAANGAHEAAIALWKRVEAQSSVHLALITDRLMDCYRALGREPEGLAWLRAALARHPSFELFNAVFAGTLKTQGAEAAYQLAQEELRRSPSLRGLDRYVEAELLGAPIERRQDLQIIKGLVYSYSQRQSMYQCEKCGFKARKFFWHCPACGSWDSFPPQKREE
ncbi:lipopolysaccharide assembly protein B [Sulfuriferula plumbiphila]|uniref:Lipopolysaccharide assembly protein B n=1 Tax=Sulfuriferula plumbiphila TaxID=171865 RepID=A0A512L802_9PROT|nr:lipopolysaccharide assembly protein LapB [Sulfuriferula plumbiphila]BBP04587.1 lipopolysaccharide assembly protein B [Sulfuriferula plumbiphila]GEP30613.1 lipopolysaccharide assembly protein B [Sulfuriferula plumbiphila]